MAEGKKHKNKPKRKIGLWVVIGIVLIIGAFFVVKMINKPTVARLIVETGEVQVNLGNSWEPAKSGMKLKENFAVKTLADSSASIVFFDSSVMRLEPETQIELDEIVEGETNVMKFDQKTGKTWNKIVRISGISEYEIKTPTAVATVRGTGFGVDLTDPMNPVIDVAEGQVGITTENDQQDVAEGQSASTSSTNGIVDVGDLRDNEWVNENIVKDEQTEEEAKAMIKKKYSTLIGIAKLNGMTEEQVDEYIDGYIEGTVNPAEEIQKGIDEGNIPKAVVPLIPDELMR